MTSSQAVVSKFLGMRCAGKHEHEPVMGGSRVTTAAGHYTKEFSRALVEAFEDQFNFESATLNKEISVNECYEIVSSVSSTGAVDFHRDVLTGDFAETDDFAPDGDAAESEDEDLGDPFVGEITPATRSARCGEFMKQLGTGHRSVLPEPYFFLGLLLLRYKLLENSSATSVQRRAPKSRRVGSLPPPRAVGEQAHLDLMIMEDALGNAFPVARAMCRDSSWRPDP